MLDPVIKIAFRNAALHLRDSEGNPPTEDRIEQMFRKFERLTGDGEVLDLNYVRAIGGGWKSNA